MIVRTWTGRTRRKDSDAYAAVIAATGLPDLRRTPGNRGAWLLRRLDGDEAVFAVVSAWDSLEQIAAFAGPQIERARYYREDDAYLLDKPELVDHWELVEGPAD